MNVTSIPSAFQNAVGTIRRSLQDVAHDAHVVANSANVESRDTIHALVDSRQQVLYTQAAARIIRASDEMTGSLLDAHA
jgi:adenylate kinase